MKTVHAGMNKDDYLLQLKITRDGKYAQHNKLNGAASYLLQ